MNRKEFTEHYIEHYINILHCPSIGKYPEKEDYLKNEIQQLADIDKISYPLALDKIYSVFFRQCQCLDAGPDSNNLGEIERDIKKAIINLLSLKRLEGKDNKDENMEH